MGCIEWNISMQQFTGDTNWLTNQGSYKDRWYNQFLKFYANGDNLCFDSMGSTGTSVNGNGCINIDNSLTLTGNTGFQHISYQYNETSSGWLKNYFQLYTINGKNICFDSSGDVGIPVSGNGCVELAH